MKIKNKDFLEMIKILDKYLKEGKKIKVENVEIYKKHSEGSYHIYIVYDEKQENNYDLFYQELSGDKVGLFYYQFEHLFCYLFDNVEKEVDNEHVLRIYKTLLNLKVTKIMNF